MFDLPIAPRPIQPVVAARERATGVGGIFVVLRLSLLLLRVSLTIPAGLKRPHVDRRQRSFLLEHGHFVRVRGRSLTGQLTSLSHGYTLLSTASSSGKMLLLAIHVQIHASLLVMPRSPSPYFRDRRYRDSPPRRYAPRDRDGDWEQDRRREDRDERSWGSYHRQRDDRQRDRDWDRPRERFEGRHYEDSDRDRDTEMDRGGYGRRPRSPSRSRSRSPLIHRPPQASASASAAASGGGGRVPSPMKSGRSTSKKSVTPEEGQITSPVRRERRSPVPVPLYRNRVQEAPPRDIARDDYERPAYREPRYPPSGPSSYSRRSPSPPPPPISRRRSRSRTRTPPRSRSPTPSSYSYSSRSRSSPEKQRSPRRPPVAQSNLSRLYVDRDRERDRDRPVGFPSARQPPSGPRSDRAPPTGPRVVSGERPSAPPSGPSAERAPPAASASSTNPYAAPIERDPRGSFGRSGVISNPPARGSPLRPQSPSDNTAPPPRLDTPTQEIENPYGRPTGQGNVGGGNAARLSWSDRKFGQARSPTRPAGPVSRGDQSDQSVQGRSPSQTKPLHPDQRNLGTSTGTEDQQSIGRQPQAPPEDPEVVARRTVEARIRAEMPSVKLWSTKPKWEMEVSAHPCHYTFRWTQIPGLPRELTLTNFQLDAHYKHLSTLQQNTVRAQSAARLAGMVLADAEGERYAAGERRKSVEAQLVASSMGVSAGLLGAI